MAPPSVDDLEQAAVVQALEENRWNSRKAAQDLDMPYSTLRYKIRRWGLQYAIIDTTGSSR